MGWETVSTSDVVSLANQLVYTLGESTARKKTLKFLIFNSSQWRFLYETKNLLVLAIITKSQDIGTEVVTNVSGTFSLLTSPSNVFLIPNERALRNYRSSSQSSLLIC